MIIEAIINVYNILSIIHLILDPTIFIIIIVIVTFASKGHDCISFVVCVKIMDCFARTALFDHHSSSTLLCFNDCFSLSFFFSLPTVARIIVASYADIVVVDELFPVLRASCRRYPRGCRCSPTTTTTTTNSDWRKNLRE